MGRRRRPVPGLPIREGPDSGSRRVYRLRAGEIIKVLSKSEGAPALPAFASLFRVPVSRSIGYDAA
jgi:hypothetical protein